MSYTISTLTLSILRCRYGVGVCVRMCVEGETAKSHFLLRTVSTSLFIYKMVSGVPFCPLLPCHYACAHAAEEYFFDYDFAFWAPSQLEMP